MNITLKLAENPEYVRSGSQLTFKVTLRSGDEFDVVFDNLAELPNGQLIIVDGKSSISKDLSKWNALIIKNKLCTKNQKMLYDHFLIGGVSSIVAKGPRANSFIGQNPKDIVNQLMPEVHFYVNDYAYQGYGIYKIIYKLGA